MSCRTLGRILLPGLSFSPSLGPYRSYRIIEFSPGKGPLTQDRGVGVLRFRQTSSFFCFLANMQRRGPDPPLSPCRINTKSKHHKASTRTNIVCDSVGNSISFHLLSSDFRLDSIPFTSPCNLHFVFFRPPFSHLPFPITVPLLSSPPLCSQEFHKPSFPSQNGPGGFIGNGSRR